MGQRYLIDSNVVIDYAANRLPLEGSDFVDQIFNNDFLVSVVVKIEVLGFNEVPHKLAILEEFIDSATLLQIDESIIQQTIVLRRMYKKLKLGDAIIAATAIVYGLVLITRNVSDFSSILGLQVMNPHDV